jgi:hypothetical protein
VLNPLLSAPSDTPRTRRRATARVAGAITHGLDLRVRISPRTGAAPMIILLAIPRMRPPSKMAAAATLTQAVPVMVARSLRTAMSKTTPPATAPMIKR